MSNIRAKAITAPRLSLFLVLVLLTLKVLAMATIAHLRLYIRVSDISFGGTASDDDDDDMEVDLTRGHEYASNTDWGPILASSRHGLDVIEVAGLRDRIQQLRRLDEHLQATQAALEHRTESYQSGSPLSSCKQGIPTSTALPKTGNQESRTLTTSPSNSPSLSRDSTTRGQSQGPWKAPSSGHEAHVSSTKAASGLGSGAPEWSRAAACHAVTS